MSSLATGSIQVGWLGVDRISRPSRATSTMAAESQTDSNRRKADRELVRRMIAGDQTAFEQFADNYIPPLYRFALRRLDRDRELAREIVQTTLCKAIAKLSTFRGEAALITWLCACCRNEIAAHYRKDNRSIREVELPSREVASNDSLMAATVDGPERALLRKENAELVHVVLDSIPPHYGQVLEWKYLDNLSVKEIAGRLTMRPKAAESMLTRARQSFRNGYARVAASGDLS